jgi:hypothetical protein
MMNSMAGRLAMVITLVVAVQLGFYAVRLGTQPPEVKLPARGIETIPREFGNWQSEEEAFDPRIFAGTEADATLSRKYKDLSGHKVSTFVALYTKFIDGLYHSPSNCYVSNNWTQLDSVKLPLKTPNRPEINVSVSTWERKGLRVLVVYWYEIGDHVLFDRKDYVPVQWAMRGRKTWPPMYKVLLQAPAESDVELVQSRLLDVAAFVRDALGKLDAGSASSDKAP